MIQSVDHDGSGRVRPKGVSRTHHQAFDAGYIGVVATNCEQTNHRYYCPGSKSASAPRLG